MGFFTTPVTNYDFLPDEYTELFQRDKAELLSNVVVTADNVQKLIKQVADDPAASQVLLDKIQESLADNPDQPALKDAAVQLAVNATGISSTLLSTALGLGDTLADVNEEDLIGDLIGGLDFARYTGVSKSFAAIFTISKDPSEYTDGEGTVDYVKKLGLGSVTTGDLAAAAIVLFFAEANTWGIVDDFNVDRLTGLDTGSDSARLFLDFAHAAVQKNDADGSGDILAAFLKTALNKLESKE
ncbi:hypothetical protein FACS189483_01540 [Spirochaetia bacterium]|nr:hypothetical protein FACS189483_01540 [Spirochaetia bacterium]